MSRQCVILAGGLGTRMWPETERVPKALLAVRGHPFAHWQLSWLAEHGIDSVVYCIGHLGGRLRDYVGAGSAWDLAVSYVDEGDALRGTAGALRLAADTGALDAEFLVLYADSLLRVDPGAVLDRRHEGPWPALMTVFRNDGRWDTSNVVFDGDRVLRYEKNAQAPIEDMVWIDYGLLALTRDVITARVPVGAAADLAPLCTDLAAAGLLGGSAVSERFYEIGTPSGRADAEDFLAGSSWPRRDA